MAISYSFASARDAEALIEQVAQCGVQPPQELTDLLDAFAELSQTTTDTDQTADLVKDVAAGRLRGEALNERIAQAHAGIQLRDFRNGLKARVEPVLVKEFVKALEAGAADAIIASLSPTFDEAAAKLAECANLVTPGADPETFLTSATTNQIKAWKAIDEHVATLTKISSVVGNFGPHSATWPLLEVPANVTSASFINNNGTFASTRRSN
jgi:hypothetical protein